MKSKELAQKIVSKLGTQSKNEHKAVDERDNDRVIYTTSLIEVAGMTITFHDETKDGAEKQAVNYLVDLLDKGDLVLSDTWAQDNL